MNPSKIMRDLARTDIFPKAAMAAARDQRDVMAPIFVDLITRLADQDRSAMNDDDVAALIPVFHMLGEFREPRAYRSVLQLLHQDSETLEYLLGDAITETSFRVVAGTFDGDLQPVFDAIEDTGADEFARSCMMDALVLIAQIHPEKRSEVDHYFRQFLSRCPDDKSTVMVGWVDGLANLGLKDMVGEIRSVFAAGLIPEEYCDVSEILDDLHVSADADGAPVNPRYRQSLITDAIEELSKWHCFSNEFLARHVLREDSPHYPDDPWSESFRNTTPKVGRNDPCPCGSGRKFKKCCLQ